MARDLFKPINENEDSSISLAKLGASGKDYLQTLIKALEERKSDDEVHASQIGAITKQIEQLRGLAAVQAMRLRPDCGLNGLEGPRAEGSPKRLSFDQQLDEDEVLVQLFWELDADKNGTISVSELLNASLMKETENAEMAKVLRRAIGCDLEAMEEILGCLDEKSFGTYKRNTNKESVLAIFEAAMTRLSMADSSRFLLRPDIEKLIEHLKSENANEPAQALEEYAAGLPRGRTDLDFLGLKEAVRRVPRVTGQRTSWAESLHLEESLARHLPPGTLVDGLKGLKEMEKKCPGSLERALDAFCEDARRIVRAAAKEVQEATGSRNAVEANSKFEGFVGKFASLEDFHRGAEETLQLGYPNPMVEEGIRHEHTEHPSVTRLFVSPNYLLATNLLLEYWFAMDPSNPPEAALKLLETIQAERMDSGVAGNVPRSSLASENANALARGDIGLEVIPGEAGPASRTLFPGEVGDEHVDVLVMLSFKATDPVKVAASLTEKAMLPKLKVEAVLRSEEEKARGVVEVLSRRACLEWEFTREHVVPLSSKDFEAKITAKESELTSETVLVGVRLPMSQKRLELEGRLEGLKKVVADVAGAVGSAEMLVRRVSQRAVVYRDVVSPTDLRKRLGELSTKELKERALQEWGVEGANREAIMDACANAFVRKELQADLEAALIGAGDEEALRKLLTLWDMEAAAAAAAAASASPEMLRKALVEALNSEEKYAQVSAWVGLFLRRMQGRRRIGLTKLMEREAERVKKYGLRMGEALCVYLYTGPEFMAMNAICRSFPLELMAMLAGNTLSTTLFCIASALKKLARFTELPAGGRVYRGLGRMLLPREFWVAHGEPAWRGGVEKAFMSTTTDKDVAMYYAGGRGTVVEISVGRVQNGGVVSWLSMVRAVGHLVSLMSPSISAGLKFSSCSNQFDLS